MSRFAVIAVSLALAGCANVGLGPAPSRTEVYRAHLGQPIAPATIALGPSNLARQSDPAVGAAIAAVSGELGKIGFTPTNDVTKAEMLGTVDFLTGTAATLAQGSPEGLRSASTLAGSAPATGLIVQIRRRSDGSMIWQGRATTHIGIPPGGTSAALAPMLARNLFQGFPGESGRTIRLP